MNLTQKLRRLAQQSQGLGWDKTFSEQESQSDIIKKIYAKNGLQIRGGGACPEQYYISKNENQIAYLRLRHGAFTVTVNDELVSEYEPNGDGAFDTEERLKFLTMAMRDILKTLK